ncbi:MAG TPA: hypothetical protein VHK91_05875, partial [Flavisolibacter sp.]|nr:hypothetical protein [Flavisolibacter sp.]
MLSMILLTGFLSTAQKDIQWKNMDGLYGPLPASVHVYFTDSPLDTGKFRAFYVVADLKDKKLDFSVDTTWKRRLTPNAFFTKNDSPLLVVNGTFFSFESNLNLNMVVKDGRLVSFNQQSIPGRKTDTLTFRHSF